MTPTTNTTDRKPMIVIVILVIIAAVVLLPRLLNNSVTSPQTSIPAQQNPGADNINVQLGAPISASGIDSSGCATDAQSTFAPYNNIYVVAPDSNVPRGTNIFVRLYRDSTAIEDAPQITADQDYFNNCINFVFQPTGQDFAVGNYEAQFFINGNAGPSVVFNVQ